MPTLTPPTRNQGPVALDTLFVRYKLPRGVTLVVNGATVTEYQYPSQTTLEAADDYFRGGYIHTISDDMATILTDAGYGAYIT